MLPFLNCLIFETTFGVPQQKWKYLLPVSDSNFEAAKLSAAFCGVHYIKMCMQIHI